MPSVSFNTVLSHPPRPWCASNRCAEGGGLRQPHLHPPRQGTARRVLSRAGCHVGPNVWLGSGGAPTPRPLSTHTNALAHRHPSPTRCPAAPSSSRFMLKMAIHPDAQASLAVQLDRRPGRRSTSAALAVQAALAVIDDALSNSMQTVHPPLQSSRPSSSAALAVQPIKPPSSRMCCRSHGRARWWAELARTTCIRRMCRAGLRQQSPSVPPARARAPSEGSRSGVGAGRPRAHGSQRTDPKRNLLRSPSPDSVQISACVCFKSSFSSRHVGCGIAGVLIITVRTCPLLCRGWTAGGRRSRPGLGLLLHGRHTPRINKAHTYRK